jgi:hypothetical protein
VNVEGANQLAVERALPAQAVLIGLRPALEVVPAMQANAIHHAGPPLEYELMCGPMRAAIAGAALFERLVGSPEEVPQAIDEGRIVLDANHHHDTVGPMAGPVSASMPVYIVRNQSYGNLAYAPIHEGLGKVLSMGAIDPAVLDNLHWIRDEGGPALAQAVEALGEINLTQMIAEGLTRGDELHNRCKATTNLFLEKLVPTLLKTSRSVEAFLRVFNVLSANPQTVATLAMAASKATMDAIAGIPGCSIMTAYARNGTTVGIRVSGLAERWFTAPAPKVKGAYFPGYTETDANPDLGDSAITETAGLGAFAQATAPAISRLVGGTAQDSLNHTLEMYEITLAEHRYYRLPALDFRGSPFLVDILKVVETGILPVCNTAISHREAGIGMIGAGMVSPPMACFEQALQALAQTLLPERP